jgi:hypothetical protein
LFNSSQASSLESVPDSPTKYPKKGSLEEIDQPLQDRVMIALIKPSLLINIIMKPNIAIATKRDFSSIGKSRAARQYETADFNARYTRLG